MPKPENLPGANRCPSICATLRQIPRAYTRGKLLTSSAFLAFLALDTRRRQVRDHRSGPPAHQVSICDAGARGDRRNQPIVVTMASPTAQFPCSMFVLPINPKNRTTRHQQKKNKNTPPSALLSSTNKLELRDKSVVANADGAKKNLQSPSCAPPDGKTRLDCPPSSPRRPRTIPPRPETAVRRVRPRHRPHGRLPGNDESHAPRGSEFLHGKPQACAGGDGAVGCRCIAANRKRESVMKLLKISPPSQRREN